MTLVQNALQHCDLCNTRLVLFSVKVNITLRISWEADFPINLRSGNIFFLFLEVLIFDHSNLTHQTTGLQGNTAFGLLAKGLSQTTTNAYAKPWKAAGSH